MFTHIIQIQLTAGRLRLCLTARRSTTYSRSLLLQLPTSEYGRVLVYDLLRLSAGVVEPDGLRLQVVVFRRQVFSKDRPVWKSRKRERTVHCVYDDIICVSNILV